MIFTDLYSTAFELIVKLRYDELDIAFQTNCGRRSDDYCGKIPVLTLSHLIIKRVCEEDLRGSRESRNL